MRGQGRDRVTRRVGDAVDRNGHGRTVRHGRLRGDGDVLVGAVKTDARWHHRQAASADQERVGVHRKRIDGFAEGGPEDHIIADGGTIGRRQAGNRWRNSVHQRGGAVDVEVILAQRSRERHTVGAMNVAGHVDAIVRPGGQRPGIGNEPDGVRVEQ